MPDELVACGQARGRTAVDRFDCAPVPSAFTAATRNRYAVPLARPVTVTEVAGAVTVTVRSTWVLVLVHRHHGTGDR